MKYVEQEKLPANTKLSLKRLENKFIIEVELPNINDINSSKLLQRVDSYSSVSDGEFSQLQSLNSLKSKPENKKPSEKTQWKNLVANTPTTHAKNYQNLKSKFKTLKKVNKRKSIQRTNFSLSILANDETNHLGRRYEFLDCISAKSNVDIGARVLRTMRSDFKNANLQIRGLVALRRLLEKGHREVAIARMGAGLIAINTIKNHLSDVAVVEPAIGLIANLCVNDKIAEALLKSGAAQAVLSSANRHMENADVILEAMIAFTNLHHGDLGRGRFLLEIDAPSAIKQAMVMHSNSPAILTEAFIAVAYLQGAWYDNEVPSLKRLSLNKTNNQGKRGKRYWKDFYELGVHSLIIQGLKSFSEDKEIQRHGLYALSCLIAGIYSRKRAIASEKKNFDHLSYTFNRFKQDATVVESAFELLFQLCGLGVGRKLVVEYELHTDILRSMRRFLEVRHDTLQLVGLKLLYVLCLKSKKVSRIIKSCGGIKTAVRANKHFPKNKDIEKISQNLALLIARDGKN